MPATIAIFGATGQQGGSLARFILTHPVLSTRFHIRALTRDPTHRSALALQSLSDPSSLSLAHADLDNPSTLPPALGGVHTVFITTTTVYNSETRAREVRQGKAAADAAVAAGAKYIIYSTEVDCSALSGGRRPVAAYDARGEVEAYIRSLPGIKSAFFAPGSFMQNLMGITAPRPDGEGGYLMSGILGAGCAVPWIDVVGDTGKFVGMILAEPERFAGKTVYAASGLFSMGEVAERVAVLTGKKVRYVQVEEEVFTGYLPEAARDPLVNMFRFFEEYGYYGPETERLVRETIEQVPDRLTSLDEYIVANVKLG